MAIDIRPTGEVEAVAQAGKKIAQGRANEQALREQAQMMAQQWELQKAQLRSQQEFQHELRLKQTALEAEARAREWEVEKLELVSRIDFQQKEQARQREMQRNQVMYDTLRHEIEKTPDLENNPQIQNRLQYYQAKAQGAEAPASLYGTPSVAMKPQNLEKDARQFLVNVLGADEAGAMSLDEGLSQAQEQGYDISRFKDLVPSKETASEYTVGQIIEVKGKKYKVVGFYPDGDPDVVEVK